MGSPADNLKSFFHKHLDQCGRCREHPLDLCNTGMIMLKAFAILHADSATNKDMSKESKG